MNQSLPDNKNESFVNKKCCDIGYDRVRFFILSRELANFVDYRVSLAVLSIDELIIERLVVETSSMESIIRN